MSSRYPPDDPDYRRRTDRPESSVRSRDHNREDREREQTRNSRRPEEVRMIDVEDRIDTWTEPRMNTRVESIRPEPRLPNYVPPPRDSRPLEPRMMENRNHDPDPGLFYQDPLTGEYHQYRSVPSRPGYPPESQFVDARTRPRVPMDAPMPMEREPSRPQYEEHFCPGDGIEREVIQLNICKYLGQDATCRPGRDKNGRSGFWIRAYRPFTSAMEHDLRQDTLRWQRDRERRVRHRLPEGTPMREYQETRSKDRAGSYAEMQAREESRRYHPEMEIDDDYDRPQRPRDPETRIPSRRQIPVTSSYPMDTGYTSANYSITSTQSSYSPPHQQSGYYNGPEREPRLQADKSTPPIMARASPSGYSQAPYTSSRSGPAITSSIPAPYAEPRTAPPRDPRVDVMMGGYPSTAYPDQSRSHRG
ncbi:hypothetical protein B0A52_07336 [Exophiala mesophila]|uniref:Uncharacterized protein n=1 Tax=Exophiala mesophila TaxID=212818 RepID=A0A438MYX8_EXOME|nr:hypothetical protein B0A52_07336 [Exophiala mesophila]